MNKYVFLSVFFVLVYIWYYAYIFIIVYIVLEVKIHFHDAAFLPILAISYTTYMSILPYFNDVFCNINFHGGSPENYILCFLCIRDGLAQLSFTALAT